MADFGVNSTQLTEAQGRGTAPLQPVQEQVAKLGMMPVFQEVAEVFAKGLVQNRKEQAEKLKNSVIGEYLANEKSFGDALTSGNLNPAQVGARSRANYTKFLAQYPQYQEELTKARASVYGGTEVGEAQKKVDAEQKQYEADISNAANRGYSFYPGMSDEAKATTIRAAKEAQRIETEFDNDEKRKAADRAEKAEGRAARQYEMNVDDYVAKDRAVEGLRTIASTNFDDLVARGKDLTAKIGSGTMTPEQALSEHQANVMRIRAGLASVAGKFPELASPWTKLFDDMDANLKQQLDPKNKSATEIQLLKDQYEKMVISGKIAAVQRDPRMLNAVVGTELFRGDPNIVLASSKPIMEWIDATINDGDAQPIVGTVNDQQLFSMAKKMTNDLQSGKVAPDRAEKYTQELSKVMNGLLKQTAGVDGSLDPKALKQAAAFYSSTEFGKLALEGKIDKQTAADAQHVFQVMYVPKVREAINSRLEQSNIAKEVNVKTVGGRVVFEPKKDNRGVLEAVGDILAPGSFGNNIDKLGTSIDVKAVKESEEALNQLIRMHAHLEGTTDYAKYWEANKHVLMPTIFPDPAKLKPGQVVDGYKYIGGNVRDRSNWIAEPTKPAK